MTPQSLRSTRSLARGRTEADIIERRVIRDRVVDDRDFDVDRRRRRGRSRLVVNREHTGGGPGVIDMTYVIIGGEPLRDLDNRVCVPPLQE